MLSESFIFTFMNDFLLATLVVPLFTLIFVYIGAPLGNSRLYNISLFSSIISFFLSLFI